MTPEELALLDRQLREEKDSVRDHWQDKYHAMLARAEKAEAENARLSSALDAAARVVARKAARERGESEKDPTISDGGGA